MKRNSNSKSRKGIILAGGTGTRLWPVTVASSKQLLPVYDKPMIFYPVSTLMLAGIKEILIITTPDDRKQFERLLGDGSDWGIKLSYETQPTPDGLAQAYLIAEKFLGGAPSAMILGDNLFFGVGLSKLLQDASSSSNNTVFGYHVNDPSQYGVVTFDERGQAVEIVEKPKNPSSNYAVTGLYFLDENASTVAKSVEPSPRGELEITSVLQAYLESKNLRVASLGRGFAWLDTGTHKNLLDAGNFVKTLTERQGLLVGSPDEVAYRQSWITREQLSKRAEKFSKNEYGASLKKIVGDFHNL